MNAEIISVGTELLMGQIVNTNAQYISQRLAELGVNVYFHSVVGDNKERITGMLKLALQRSELVVVTGGLGPTQDDITKETVAEILGLALSIDKKSEDNLRQFFKNINKPMSSSNIKQAMIPYGAVVIPNSNGTAPGCIINFGEITIVLLPGPPKEMKPMLDKFIDYYLNTCKTVIRSRFLKIFGLGESTVEEKIIDLIKVQTNPTIAPYIDEGEVILRVTARCSDEKEAEKLMNPILDEIKNRLGHYIYSMQGEALEEVVLKLLKEQKKTIAVAESCTGGMIASRLTKVPGASEVFERGVVSYSNEAKMNLLGVNRQVLEQFGAVSHEVAKQMADCIRKNSATNIGLSITGIAGPGGGTPERPVGLVYIALSDENDTESWEFRFFGDRGRIRNLSVLSALDVIRKKLIRCV